LSARCAQIPGADEARRGPAAWCDDARKSEGAARDGSRGGVVQALRAPWAGTAVNGERRWREWRWRGGDGKAGASEVSAVIAARRVESGLPRPRDARQ
jgi:hypothetical protein